MNHGGIVGRAIQQYNIGELLSFKRINHGFANKNFEIHTTKGKYLLRFPKQQTIENQEKECLLMQVLKWYDFPTAYPIADKNGRSVSGTDKFTCILYEFIEGEIPKINTNTVTNIALALSYLHKIPTNSIPQKSNTIQPNGIEELISKFSSARNQLPAIFKRFNECYLRLKPFLYISLPAGLIHGDLFPDNTIFSGNQLKAIIDFEEFCIDYFLFDIGMTINGFCFRNNQLDNMLLDNFITTYQITRKLTKTELELLPVYIQWTALGMISWHLKNQLIDKQNPRQERRVLELLEHIESVNTRLFQNPYPN